VKRVIVYHSVSSEAYPGALGSYPVTVERMEQTIEGLLRDGWRFDTLENIHVESDDKVAYITHDDGTSDWFHNALPMLERRGIPSTAFVVSGTDLGIYPVTHLVQVALVADVELPKYELTDAQIRHIDIIYGYETDLRRRYFKGYMNFYCENPMELLSEKLRDYMVDRFTPICEYKQFRSVTLGVHGVNHIAYDGTEDYVTNEIDDCRDYIRCLGYVPSRFVCLPMRPKHEIDIPILCEYLQNRGYKGLIDGAGEWQFDNFVIPRTDGARL